MQDLLNAYCFPGAALKPHVFPTCGKEGICLEP